MRTPEPVGGTGNVAGTCQAAPLDRGVRPCCRPARHTTSVQAGRGGVPWKPHTLAGGTHEADTLTRFADLMADDLTERPDTAPAGDAAPT
ncbi:MAG: hypothetical protein QM658_04780, partial [Gordonia sp. (in: high G+C Gram-positive bacteria)]